MIKQKKKTLDPNWKALQLKARPLSPQIASSSARRQAKTQAKAKLTFRKAAKEAEKTKKMGRQENELTAQEEKMVEGVFNPALPNKKEETKKLSLDCEMVELDGSANGLARVSVVNYHGHILLDRIVRPPRGARITDFRTKYSGISAKLMWGSPSHMVLSHEEALLHTKKLLKDAVVVGHSLWNDFSALQHEQHPQKELRDLASSSHFKDDLGRPIALRKLSERYLGKKIQEGSHSSVEDARAALALYRLKEKELDEEVEGKTERKIKQYFGKGRGRSLDQILAKKKKKKEKKELG